MEHLNMRALKDELESADLMNNAVASRSLAAALRRRFAVGPVEEPPAEIIQRMSRLASLDNRELGATYGEALVLHDFYESRLATKKSHLVFVRKEKKYAEMAIRNRLRTTHAAEGGGVDEGLWCDPAYREWVDLEADCESERLMIEATVSRFKHAMMVASRLIELRRLELEHHAIDNNIPRRPGNAFRARRS